MQTPVSLRDIAKDVGLAIRRPEELVLRWHGIDSHALEMLIAVLLLNAIFGTAAYGVTMQMHKGALAMLQGGVLTTLAAGGAWVIALPSLYIIRSALGAQMSLRASVLVASVTVCFGAWAMLASVPINWFFTLALPYAGTRVLINLTVFAGVGFCMTDVFLRSLRALEPDRDQTFGYFWVLLLAVIGTELFVLFGVFTF
jgi:hypothetical protein